MNSKPPFFSIIIPTYERPEPLRACLQSFAEVDYPGHRFELIVVDDGSETPLEETVVPFRQHLDLTYTRLANAGPAAARNIGAAKAKGPFIAFTDDDCMVASNWLSALASRVVDAPDAMIGGRSVNALPHDPYATTSQIMTDAVYAYFNADMRQAQFFPSNNVALPLEGFRKIGGFDTSFPLAAAEDREFCDRWLHMGCRMIYAPEVVVHHAHRLTLRQFWQQHVNYGRGAFDFHRAKKNGGRGQVKTDLRFYAHLLRYPWGHVSRKRVVLIETLLILSHVAKTIGFVREKALQAKRSA